MKQTIAIIIVASMIISVLVFSYNYINICVADDNNGKYTISECIDNNLINSTLIIICGVILVYTVILLLKFRIHTTDDEKLKLLNDYYNYVDTKRATEAAKILKDKQNKEN